MHKDIHVGDVVVKVAEFRRKRLSELRGLLAPRKGTVQTVRDLRKADLAREEKRAARR